tara:strand:+ start:30 stop:461 length:432 start_codon:yes stop_codon:yes gene_type:complete
MKINAEIIGTDKIVGLLKQRLSILEDRSKLALEKVGAALWKESVERVPRVTGNLARSAGMRFADRPHFKSYAVVFFNMEYAVYVHENVNEKWKGKNRPKTKQGESRGTYWDNGRSKYLESAWRDNVNELQDIARAVMWKGLSG